MPEIDFFAESQDIKNLVGFVLSSELRIVPDLGYTDSKTIEISDWAQFAAIRAKSNLLYLIYPPSLLSPLALVYVEQKGEYRILQRHGGPSLSLLFFEPSERDGTRWIPSGSLSHFSTYRNTISGEYQKIPDAIRRKYRELVRYVKYGSRIARGCREYWVLPHARTALADGAQLAAEGVTVQ